VHPAGAVLRQERAGVHIQRQGPVTGDLTFGGYSEQIVVTEGFVRKFANLDLARVAPCFALVSHLFHPTALKVGPGRRSVWLLGGLGQWA